MNLKIASVLTFSVICLLNTACVEYTSPICNSTNLTDSNIEGEKKFMIYSNFEGEELVSEITRTGKGTYQAAAAGEVQDINTCKTSKGLYAEFKTPFGTYMGDVLNHLPNGNFMMASHFVSKSVLDREKIPYTIELRKESVASVFMKKMGFNSVITNANDEGVEVIVIKNDAKSTKSMIQYGQTASIGMIYQQ